MAAQQVSVAVDALRPLADGDVVRVGGGGVALRVLHTPGHSPGSITLVASSDGEARASPAAGIPPSWSFGGPFDRTSTEAGPRSQRPAERRVGWWQERLALTGDTLFPYDEC